MNGLTPRVSTKDLLAALERNRAGHRAVFEEALEGWRRKVIETLEWRLADAKAGRKVDLAIHLPQPTDHTDDYDAAIAMLQMHTGDEIEIGDDDFRQYVLDDWDWKGRFMATNSAYTRSA